MFVSGKKTCGNRAFLSSLGTFLRGEGSGIASVDYLVHFPFWKFFLKTKKSEISFSKISEKRKIKIIMLFLFC